MIDHKFKEKCCGCSACVAVCPTKCISMEEDEEGFKYPRVLKDQCIKCGKCMEVCLERESKTPDQNIRSLYYAYNINEGERNKSSSGGIFILLAKWCLGQKGVVFGAAYVNNQVNHIKICGIDELPRVLGSKYVQSNINYVYTEVREELKTGKYVLFSGTPCQIVGLKRYLNDDYQNLICISVVCHGVLNPKIYRAYYKLDISKNNSILINFRDKKTGWKNYSITVTRNDKSKSQLHDDNLLFRAYLSDLISRPSCYKCIWKKQIQYADFILGDAWGVQKRNPGVDDDKGLSLVVLISEKAEKIWTDINNNVRVYPAVFDEVVLDNPSILKSAVCNKNKDIFLKKIKRNPRCIKVYLWKYCHRNFFAYLKIKLHKLIT